MANIYNLKDLPEWKQHDETPVAIGAELPRWSGSSPPPAIGERVNLFINSFGPATVVSYFVEHGFLGIECKLDKVPDWLERQCERAGILPRPKVFGAELVSKTRKGEVT